MTEVIQNYFEAVIPVFALAANIAVWYCFVRGFLPKIKKLPADIAGFLAGLLFLLALTLLDDPAEVSPLLTYGILSYVLLSFGFAACFKRGAGSQWESSPGFSDENLFLTASALGCSIFTYALSALLLIHGGELPKASDQQLYVAALVVLPPIAFFLTRLIFKRISPLHRGRVLLWNLIYLCFVLFYGMGCSIFNQVKALGLAATQAARLNVEVSSLASQIDLSVLRIHEAKIFLIAPLIHGLGCLVAYRMSLGLSESTIGKWRDRMVPAFLALAGISAALSIDWAHGRLFFYGIWGDLGVARASNTAALILSFAAAVAFAGILLKSKQWASKWPLSTRAAAIFSGVIAVVAVVLAIDPGLSFDFYHNNPYYGPAIRLLHGGIPLVDTFCQYGVLTPYFYALGFHLFPHSLQVSGLIANALNLLFDGAFVLLVFRVVRNRWIAVPGALLAVWFHHLSMGNNIPEKPMLAGIRFLPDMLFLLSLSYLRPGERIRFHTILTLLLAGAWAFESALFCTGTAIAFFFAQSLISGDAWKRLLLWTLLPVAVILAEYALYSVVIHSMVGQWPRYSVYWEIIAAQSSGNGDWGVPISPEVFAWVPMFVVYFAALLYLWKERVRADGGIDWNYLHVVFPAATMGVLEGYYFAARSIPAILVTVFFPFAVVVLSTLDRIKPRRAISGVVGASFVVLLATCILHLMKPMYSCSPNNTWLRHCLSGQDCSPGKLWAEWSRKLVSPTYLEETRPDADGCGYFRASRGDSRPIIRDAIVLAGKYAPAEQKIATLFPMEDGAILFHLGKEHRLSISSTRHDNQSPTLIAQYVDNAKALKAGEVIITLADRAPFGTIEQKIYESVESRFRLCQLEETSAGVVALRLEAKDQPCR